MDLDLDLDLDLPLPPPQPLPQLALSSTNNSPNPTHKQPTNPSPGLAPTNTLKLSTPAKIAHMVRLLVSKAKSMDKVSRLLNCCITAELLSYSYFYLHRDRYSLLFLSF